MSALKTLRRSLNQLTDHGSQKCLECLEHRRLGMAAVDEIEAALACALPSGDATRPAPDPDQATLRAVLMVDQQTESSTSAVTSRSLRPTGDKE